VRNFSHTGAQVANIAKMDLTLDKKGIGLETASMDTSTWRGLS
jgi:hypothetical protein